MLKVSTNWGEQIRNTIHNDSVRSMAQRNLQRMTDLLLMQIFTILNPNSLYAVQNWFLHFSPPYEEKSLPLTII